MSVVTVRYHLSSVGRKAIVLRTGNMPQEIQEVAVDMSALDDDQRGAILEASGDWSGDLAQLDLCWEKYGKKCAFESVMDAAGIVAKCVELREAARREKAESDARLAQELSDRIEARLGRVLCAIKTRALANMDSEWEYTISRDDRAKCARLGLSLEALDKARADYAEIMPQLEAEAAERKRLERERAEAAEREREAKKAAELHEKITWANEHGSDRLKRALAAGHDSSRLYWLERAAVEWPGFVLDYDGNLNNKERNAAPSISALDKRDEILAEHPDVTATIVWATRPDDFIDDKIGEPRCKYKKWADEYDYTEHEAIVVDDPRYSRMLWIDIA